LPGHFDFYRSNNMHESVWDSVLNSAFWISLLQVAGQSIIVAIADLIKIVIVYVVAKVLLHKLIDGLSAQVVARGRGGEADAAARAARARTLQGLLKSVVAYVLFFIAAVMTLRAFSVDPTPVLTAAGVVGLAVGFGAQRLVRDVITGFFILLENQFSVGEYVTMAGVTGSVEEIGMRITRLRDDSGKLNIIPNGDIASVCNHSRGAVSASIDISIAANADPKEVAELLDAAGEVLAREQSGVVSPLKYVGIIAMDGTKLTLRFAGSCEADALEVIQMAARERFRDVLRDAGIGLL
jgi:moderate conductance mechanosensitive channel